jgi:hypothetical protein
VLVETGFTLKKLYILGIVLIEQFPKNLQRSTKAGNRDVLSTTEFSSLKIILEHKPTALIPHEKVSISGRII